MRVDIDRDGVGGISSPRRMGTAPAPTLTCLVWSGESAPRRGGIMRAPSATRTPQAGRSACRNRRSAFSFAALAVLAAVVVGCGGGGDNSTATTAGTEAAQRAHETIRKFGLEATAAEAKQAKAAMLGYQNARVAGEWSKACSYLAKPIRRLFGRIGSKTQEGDSKGCAGFVETSTRKLSPSERSDLAKVQVISVRVEDDQGYVLYKDVKGDEFANSMKIEGGKWKIGGITGTPLS